MVTISIKNDDLFLIGEALYEYGMSLKNSMIGETTIRILRRLKGYEKARSTKVIYDEWIKRIKTFQDIPVITYKKTKKVS